MSWKGPLLDITGDSSLVNDGPRANSAIDLCQGVTYIVRVVFCLAGLRNSADTAGAAQNVNTTVIEASIDFIAVPPSRTSDGRLAI